MTKSYCRSRSNLAWRLVAGLLLTACVAPAAYGDGWSFWPFTKEDQPGKPDKVSCFWNDTILSQTGQPAIRGFGGRLMFYEGKSEDPIKVEGTLVVYAFDETDRDANNNRPDRKYVITTEQLPQHYSKSKVGHSYSVWIPWDEVGGPQKQITLIVRFQPKGKDIPVTISEPCRQLLPGRVDTARAALPPGQFAQGQFAQGQFAPRQFAPGQFAPGQFAPGQFAPMQAAAPGNWGGGMVGTPPPMGYGVQPVMYQAPVNDGAGPAPNQPRIMTTTIDVPPGSTIRSAITLPQAPAPGAAGPYQTAPAGATGPAQNYQPQNYQPQNYYPGPNYQPQSYRGPNYNPTQGYAPAAPATPSNYPTPASSAAPTGLQLRAGFQPGRQWPLGEPLAQLGPDRAPLPPRPAGSPYGPSFQPAQANSNAAPAAPQGGQPGPN